MTPAKTFQGIDFFLFYFYSAVMIAVIGFWLLVMVGSAMGLQGDRWLFDGCDL
jgi:hypothetical protein